MAAERSDFQSMVRRVDDWQWATGLLDCAESLTVSHAELMRLSEDVIRTRNAVTVDKIRIGMIPPPDSLRRWARDEALLGEGDDTTGSRRSEKPVST
jgi:hypothetical protein